MSRRRAALWALALLALAFPNLIGPAFAVVVAVAGWALAHLSLVCTLAAAVLLAHAFPKPTSRAAWFFGLGALTAYTATRPHRA